MVLIGQRLHSLGILQLDWGEEANLSLMVKLEMRKSSRLHCVDTACLGEITLTQRELERKGHSGGLFLAPAWS